MAVKVSIDMFGDTFFKRRIIAMRHRAQDMSPVLRDIGEDWLDIVEEQFATEGARSGHPWKQLKLWTWITRKSRHPILVRTGDLLIHMTNPELLDVSDDSVTLELPSSEQAKAASHQFGFFNARANTHVVARPMIDFTDIDEARFRRKIGNYLTEGDA